MCDVVTGAMAAQAVSAIGGLAVQSKLADAQGQMNANAKQNSLQQWAQQITELNQEKGQNEQAAMETKREYDLEYARAAAEFQVKSTSAGIGGTYTAGRVQHDLAEQNRRRTAQVDTNLKWQNTNTAMQTKAAGLAHEGRQSALPQVHKPSYLSAGLQIAGAGIDAHANELDKKNKANAKKLGLA